MHLAIKTEKLVRPTLDIPRAESFYFPLALKAREANYNPVTSCAVKRAKHCLFKKKKKVSIFKHLHYF